jgi:hypothetical protein
MAGRNKAIWRIWSLFLRGDKIKPEASPKESKPDFHVEQKLSQDACQRECPDHSTGGRKSVFVN